MPKSKSKELCEKAISNIQSGKWPAEDPLPNVESLAFDWSVAKNTANLVLKRLRDLGYVHKPRGSNRYYLKSQISKISTLDTPEPSRSLQIAKILEKKILQGYYKGQNQLPSLKELQHEFGASYGTVRDVRDSLIAKGFINLKGKKLTLAKPIKPEQNLSRLYVYGSKGMYYDYFLSQAIRQIEQTSLSMGWGRLGFFFNGDDVNPPPGHLVAGYIVLNDLDGFLNHHISRDIPLTVLDRGFDYFEDYSQFKFCARVRPDEKQAGHKMGLYLNEIGHRQVAFFTHLPVHTSWVSLRLQNLKPKFEQCEVYDLKEPIGSPLKGLRTASRQPLSHFFGDEYKKLISANLIHKVYLKRAEDTVTMIQIAKLMKPLFEQALQNRKITAWVCVNDTVALAANQFLRNRMVKVPEKISVTGFDNHSMAQIEELTTFDMQYDRIGYSLVDNFYLRPKVNVKKDTKITGELIPRKSSGPPPANR